MWLEKIRSSKGLLHSFEPNGNFVKLKSVQWHLETTKFRGLNNSISLDVTWSPNQMIQYSGGLGKGKWIKHKNTSVKVQVYTYIYISDSLLFYRWQCLAHITHSPIICVNNIIMILCF